MRLAHCRYNHSSFIDLIIAALIGLRAVASNVRSAGVHTV
jgi:hypothetical protein